MTTQHSLDLTAGSLVYVDFGRVKVVCFIVGHVNGFLMTRICVRPMLGDGEVWVSLRRCSEIPPVLLTMVDEYRAMNS